MYNIFTRSHYISRAEAILCLVSGATMMISDVLKFPHHFSDTKQVLLDKLKCTVISCRTKQFFIGKFDISDSFQELSYMHVHSNNTYGVSISG